MNFTYTISGMTCGGCAAKVKSAFLSHPDVLSAEISHQDGTAKVQAQHMPDRGKLEKLLASSGAYRITGVSEDGGNAGKETLQSEGKREQSSDRPQQSSDMSDHSSGQPESSDMPEQAADSVWETYKPLVLIFLFVAGTAAIASWDSQSFSWPLWMRYFMAGFFLVFSFFKFLDLNGFARSFGMYDLLARRWSPYGHIYPFLELGLGILYLTGIHLPATHVATILVMGISSAGVLNNMLSPNQIQCACLGTIFKLPLGRVTLIEDLLMVAMAGVMLVIG
jgi:copper chaperone CopZ